MWFGRGRLEWWLRRLAVGAEVLVYLYWLDLDFNFSLRDPQFWFWQPITGGVVATVVLLRRVNVTLPIRAAFTACTLSTLVTIVSAVLSGIGPDAGSPMSYAEQIALAIGTIAAMSRSAGRRAWLVAVTSGVALIGSAGLRPVPDLPGGTDNLNLTLAALSTLGWVGAVAIGLALRENKSRRLAELADARSAERMELARELHDVVAHHVTGIVVAAQAATVVAETDPDEVVPALESIERAGGDALGAMRQIVGVLRGQEVADGARSPGADLAGVDEMVRRFDSDRGVTRLRTDPEVAAAALPAGVAATGYRIVQEALTNVRRHAPRATAVEVDLRRIGEHLLVEVRNDGVETRPATVLDRGGFGLAGMTERVFALGGDLSAGPTGPGTWTVSARLPIRAAA